MVDPTYFGDLMESVDNALQSGGLLISGKRDARADWKAFAAELGSVFFDEKKARKPAEVWRE